MNDVEERTQRRADYLAALQAIAAQYSAEPYTADGPEKDRRLRNLLSNARHAGMLEPESPFGWDISYEVGWVRGASAYYRYSPERRSLAAGTALRITWAEWQARAMYDALRKCWHENEFVNEFVSELGRALDGGRRG